jgi:hypothetical protein
VVAVIVAVELLVAEKAVAVALRPELVAGPVLL